MNPTKSRGVGYWGKQQSFGSSFPEFLRFCKESLSEGYSAPSKSYSILKVGYRSWREFMENGGAVLTPSKKENK